MFAGFRSRWMTPWAWGLAERAADLARDVDRALFGEMARVADGTMEGLPLQVLHRHEVDVVVRLPVVEHGDRVRMGELRGDAGFEEEALVKLGVLRAGVAGVQDLHGAHPTEGRLLRAIDPSHAAASDEGGDLEATTDDAPDERIGRAAPAHRNCSRRAIAHEPVAP